MNSSSWCATKQKQYQRRVQNQREALAREAVLEELVTQEGAKRVILAGDKVAIPLLHQALSPQFEPLILLENNTESHTCCAIRGRTTTP